MRRALITLLALLRVRLELAGLEVQQEVDRVLGMLGCLLAATLLLCFGAAFGLLALTLALPQTQRWLTLSLGAAVFVATGGGLLVWALRAARQRPPIFGASTAQLDADQRQLGPP